MTGRKQAVYCNGNQSVLKNIDKGIPQDSVLGLLLFLVYINDISNASAKLIYVLFPDNTNFLMTDKTLDELHAKVNSELEKISTWV